MNAPTLFPLPEADASTPKKERVKGAPRLRLADRAQVRLVPSSLDGLQVIVGVDVSNKGSDLGELPPMVDQIAERCSESPDALLVDGGFVKLVDIERVSGPPHDCKVYAPVPKPRDPKTDPHARRRKDKEHVAEWRQRMGTEPAKEIYKERAATAECVNAIARNRGLRQFAVRGLAAVKAIALLFALAHNVARAIALA